MGNRHWDGVLWRRYTRIPCTAQSKATSVLPSAVHSRSEKTFFDYSDDWKTQLRVLLSTADSRLPDFVRFVYTPRTCSVVSDADICAATATPTTLPATPGPGIHVQSLSIDREAQFQRHSMSCNVFYSEKDLDTPCSVPELITHTACRQAKRRYPHSSGQSSTTMLTDLATTLRCAAGLVQYTNAFPSRHIGLRDVSLAVPPHL
jgi:hypothetical protein